MILKNFIVFEGIDGAGTTTQQKLLQKKHYNPEQADYKERQKMFAFLMRKGYSGEQISKALMGGEGLTVDF